MLQGIDVDYSVLEKHTLHSLYEVKSEVELLSITLGTSPEEDQRILNLDIDEPLSDALLDGVGPNFAKMVRDTLTTRRLSLEDYKAGRYTTLEASVRASGLPAERIEALLQGSPLKDESEADAIAKGAQQTLKERES